jgi:3-hexulose-6-phosphate synthase
MPQEKADRVRLQIALDFGDTSSLLHIGRQVADYVDWIEAGTPWMMAEGMRAVRALRDAFPDKSIVADLKIVDAGKHEAEIAFAAGADMVTVLGVASDATIRDTLLAARDYGHKVVLDLLQVRHLAERVREVMELGVHYVVVHTGHDDLKAGLEPWSDLALVSRLAQASIVVAGGVGAHNIERISAYRPYAIVIGRSVTEAPDPRTAAKQLREIVDQDD